MRGSNQKGWILRFGVIGFILCFFLGQADARPLMGAVHAPAASDSLSAVSGNVHTTAFASDGIQAIAADSDNGQTSAAASDTVHTSAAPDNVQTSAAASDNRPASAAASDGVQRTAAASNGVRNTPSSGGSVPSNPADIQPSQVQADSVYDELQSGKTEDPADAKPDWDKDPVHPTVYLTFDDGPSKLTPKVLDILKKNGIKATFFMLGNEAERYPDTVKAVMKAGHSIGNHSYDHVYHTLYSDADAFWNEVSKTSNILESLTGKRPTLFRAPGGTYTNFDPFYFYYMKNAGFSINDWNIDSGDSARAHVPASEIISTVEKGPFPNKIVLLMHDGAGHDTSVAALPAVIQFFKKKGYDFAPLTPHTKPITFRVGKVKWNRTITRSQNRQLVAETDAYRIETEREQLQAREAASFEERSKSDAAASVKNQGRFVPLRDLAKAEGGYATWDADTRKATLVLPHARIEYDTVNGQVTGYRQNERAAEQPLPVFYLKEGRMMIPDRATRTWVNSGQWVA